jgi:GT2 family glycosyltransferase
MNFGTAKSLVESMGLITIKVDMNKFRSDRIWQKLRVLRRTIAPDGSYRADMVHVFFHALFTLRDGGVITFLKLVYSYATGKEYITYKMWIAKNENWDTRRIDQEITSFSYQPTISVIVPVYNISPEWLDKCIQSVASQVYGKWELCLYDDASNNPSTIECLKKWQESDKKIKIAFGKKNLNIAEATNKAIDMVTGEFIAFLDHDDELSPYALYFVVRALNKNPELDLLYSDEDKITEKGLRDTPYFKPDWNPDLFLSQNYMNHLSVFRTKIVRMVGGCRKGLEGAQDWDLALRIIETIPESHIQHIPYILYHWRRIPGSFSAAAEEKSYIGDAQLRCLSDHFTRLHQDVELIKQGQYWRAKHRIPDPAPLVSLIIPTRDGYHLLHRCIESIYEKSTYRNFEIIVVDNDSEDPRTLTYLSNLEEEGRARVLKYPGDFNYSATNNFAVAQSKGQIIGLLNNDLEAISAEWLEEMMSQALRPEIGAVGARLLYPNDTIQHVGVILGIGGIAGHWFKGLPNGQNAHFSRPNLVQNLSAVTAACMLVKRSIYEEVGGLDDVKLKIAFNDVDFCLRVMAKGHRNLYTPFAVLYHHESASRGRENTPEKKARFKLEEIVMKQRWGKLLLNDPAYNPNLTLVREDGGIASRTRAEQI